MLNPLKTNCLWSKTEENATRPSREARPREVTENLINNPDYYQNIDIELDALVSSVF